MPPPKTEQWLGLESNHGGSHLRDNFWDGIPRYGVIYHRREQLGSKLIKGTKQKETLGTGNKGMGRSWNCSLRFHHLWDGPPRYEVVCKGNGVLMPTVPYIRPCHPATRRGAKKISGCQIAGCPCGCGKVITTVSLQGPGASVSHPMGQMGVANFVELCPLLWFGNGQTK